MTLRIQNRLGISVLTLALVISTFSISPATSSTPSTNTSMQSSATSTLTTCTNLETGKTLVLRSTDSKCRSHLGSALWVQEQSDSPSRTGVGYTSMTICSSKYSFYTYRLIKDSCPKFQVTTNYWRTVAAPSAPVIEAASARGHDSAVLFIKPTTSALSAPVLYYLVTETKSGLIRKVIPGSLGQINISGLSSESTYTFAIAAINVDGTSPASLQTPSIKTSAAPVVASTPQVALTCATGGTCVVGDRGPGGGTIFYVATTPFVCGSTRTLTCKHLEAAPAGWKTDEAQPGRMWAQQTPINYDNTSVGSSGSPETATATGVGWGHWNTRAIILQGNTDPTSSAAALADSYDVTVSGTLYDDWFLPSKDELNQLISQKETVALLGTRFSSSTEANAGSPWFQFYLGLQIALFKSTLGIVWPIRSF